MRPQTENRALQIAFPKQQIVLRPSFLSNPVAPFVPAKRYGTAPKPFLVSPGMSVPDRSAARPKHRVPLRSAAAIRQREAAARVIAIDRRRPVEAVGRNFMHHTDENLQMTGTFHAFRPVVRLGHQIAGWLRPSR